MLEYILYLNETDIGNMCRVIIGLIGIFYPNNFYKSFMFAFKTEGSVKVFL